jgi:hypothetical protein
MCFIPVQHLKSKVLQNACESLQGSGTRPRRNKAQKKHDDETNKPKKKQSLS